MIGGARATQLVYVAAKLGIADLLKDGPKGCDELSQSLGTHPQTLYRVMRALPSLGVFSENEDGRFELTSLGELLQTGAPGSLRGFAVMTGEEWFWRSYGDLLHGVLTGETAFDHVHGRGLFEYLEQDSEAAQVFHEAMTSLSGPQSTAVVAAYDFSGIGKIVDVGGGRGTLMSAILKANPKMHGVLYDLPSVIEHATSHLVAEGVADRCELVAGSFFESVPRGGDAYILKWIIHDWDDRRAVEVLRNCRRAMADSVRLLLVERLVSKEKRGASAKLADITMLVIPGGRERTEDEYSTVLNAASFRLTRILPTESELNIIEGVPV